MHDHLSTRHESLTAFTHVSCSTNIVHDLFQWSSCQAFSCTTGFQVQEHLLDLESNNSWPFRVLHGYGPIELSHAIVNDLIGENEMNLPRMMAKDHYISGPIVSHCSFWFDGICFVLVAKRRFGTWSITLMLETRTIGIIE